NEGGGERLTGRRLGVSAQQGVEGLDLGQQGTSLARAPEQRFGLRPPARRPARGVGAIGGDQAAETPDHQRDTSRNSAATPASASRRERRARTSSDSTAPGVSARTSAASRLLRPS